jgi:hypothetical protein
VPLLHERLVFVLAQRFAQAQTLVVGHQGEQAVAACLPRHRRAVLLEAGPVVPGLDPPVFRVRPRPPRAHLPVAHLHRVFDLDAQQALHLLVGRDAFSGLAGLAGGAWRPAASGCLQPLQPGAGAFQPAQPVLAVLLLLLGAAIPQEAVALRGELRRLHPVVNHVRAVLPPRVGLAVDLTPLQRVVLEVVAEEGVLGACPGHDGQETSLTVGNVAHVVPRAELAVGHVEEVGVAEDAAQEVPGVGMHLVVAGVAVVGLAVDRHGAVGADGKAEQQLLEVGAVVLVVAEGDARRAAGLVGGRLAGIVPTEGDGGGVLMELGQVDVEGADGVQDQGGQQAGAIGPTQVVQGAAEAVVVEQAHLVRLQAEVFGDAAGDPGGEGIKGLTGQQQVAHQDGQGDGRRQARPPSRQRREVALEQLGQLQSPQEMPDQGGGADLEGLQGSVLPGQGHGRLRLPGRGRAVCYGSSGAAGNGEKGAEKILARLGCEGGQPGQDFFYSSRGLAAARHGGRVRRVTERGGCRSASGRRHGRGAGIMARKRLKAYSGM